MSLQVHYRSKKLQRVCENPKDTIRIYGKAMAERIHECIDYIKAASAVKVLVQFRIGRCHRLTGDREGQYAMDLMQPYRLIFVPEDDLSVSVRIEEITDYH